MEVFGLEFKALKTLEAAVGTTFFIKLDLLFLDGPDLMVDVELFSFTVSQSLSSHVYIID